MTAALIVKISVDDFFDAKNIVDDFFDGQKHR